MSKRKKMPKGLQIHHLKKSIRKELKEKYSNSDIDIEAVMDKIDFEALVDNTHELDENYKTVVEFINREFGISGEDYSLIYELEKIGSCPRIIEPAL